MFAGPRVPDGLSTSRSDHAQPRRDSVQQRRKLSQRRARRVRPVCHQHVPPRARHRHPSSHGLQLWSLGDRKDVSDSPPITAKPRPPPPPRPPRHLWPPHSPLLAQPVVDNVPPPPQPTRHEARQHLPHRAAHRAAVSPDVDRPQLVAREHPCAQPVPVQSPAAAVIAPLRPVPVRRHHPLQVGLPVGDILGDLCAAPLTGRVASIEVEDPRRRLVAEWFCG